MSRSELRETVKDLVGPFDAWPELERDCFFRVLSGVHISNSNRFKLICFLLVNGLHPDLVRGVFNFAYSSLS